MAAQLMNEHPPGCDLMAVTPWGMVRLQLPWGKADDAQGLIQQLSHWCQQSLVLTETQAAETHRQGGALLGTVCDVRLAPIGTQIELPFELMRSTPPPLALQGASIKWPQLTFHVTVASLEEADIEPRHVQEGGLMLLPHAFQSPWLVHLTEQNQACQLVGHLHLDAGRIDLHHVQDAPADLDQEPLLVDDAWQVQLARRVVLDLPVAMGWVPGVNTAVVDYSCDEASQSDFGLSAQLRHFRKGLLLRGIVIPVMMGAALRVHAVHSET
jgi:hypothetical protein